MSTTNSPLRLTALALAFAGCDAAADADYRLEVVSATEVAYDDRGMPGLAFAVRNAGSLPVYGVQVTVRPLPFDLSEHAAQRAGPPLAPGAVDTVRVPLPSRASHADYDCYTYVVSGSAGPPVPGTVTRAAFEERSEGTCR